MDSFNKICKKKNWIYFRFSTIELKIHGNIKWRLQRARNLVNSDSVVSRSDDFSLLFSPLTRHPPFRLCALLYAHYAITNATVQRFWATVHQLHERETATILQSSHVRTRARGIQERRDRVAIYRLWDGLGFLYRTDREGIAARKGEILEERECEMKRYDDTREKRKKKKIGEGLSKIGDGPNQQAFPSKKKKYLANLFGPVWIFYCALVFFFSHAYLVLSSLLRITFLNNYSLFIVFSLFHFGTISKGIRYIYLVYFFVVLLPLSCFFFFIFLFEKPLLLQLFLFRSVCSKKTVPNFVSSTVQSFVCIRCSNRIEMKSEFERTFFFGLYTNYNEIN